VLAGLGLALGSAALINLGFLLQHRGLTRVVGPTATAVALLRGSLRRPEWIAGQALGLLGFAGQIAAVALAPLALVQAFSAGGLALSLPLATRLLGHRLRRSQTVAIVAIAGALACLPLGLPAFHEHLHTVTLALILGVMGTGATLTLRTRVPALMAVAAGLFYGITDAVIKAITVLWGPYGAQALLTAWLPVALLATVAGFVSFQAALRTGDGVDAVVLMTALASVSALACGLVALGEPYGTGPLTAVVHLVAVGVVLVCVRPLASAQSRLVEVAR